MALFQDPRYVKVTQDPAFDAVHQPGAETPHAGIYRCEVCGREVACRAGTALPPIGHHQHAPTQPRIEWRLLVYAC